MIVKALYGVAMLAMFGVAYQLVNDTNECEALTMQYATAEQRKSPDADKIKEKMTHACLNVQTEGKVISGALR